MLAFISGKAEAATVVREQANSITWGFMHRQATIVWTELDEGLPLLI